MIAAFIAGCSGPELTPDERAFFRDAAPWGFILFRRNVETPAQVAALTAELRAAVGRADAPGRAAALPPELRAAVGRADAPVLIDQEGGRVQRLRPPHWPAYPPGRAYGQLYARDPVVGRELTRLAARLIAHDLLAVGVTVDCLPVLDVPVRGAH